MARVPGSHDRVGTGKSDTAACVRSNQRRARTVFRACADAPCPSRNFALTKIIADKPIADADIPAILIVSRDSYDSLICIEDAADREPRATRFVLSSLSGATTDPETIKKTADTTRYLDAQYATYAKAHPTQ
jgi:hypothetical protein